MKHLIDEFSEYLRIEKRNSPHTVSGYCRDLNLFSVFINGRNIKSLKTTDIRDFLVFLRKQGLSESTVARNLSSIKSLFKYLYQDKQLSYDPAEIIKSPKGYRKLPVVLSLKDIDKLLNSPDENTSIGLRDKAMLEILYATGLRVSELVNLKVSELDLEIGCLRTMGKGDKERIVPIGSMAKNAVNQYILNPRSILLRGRKTSELFITKRGKCIGRNKGS